MDRVLEILALNARISIEDIAAMVELSPVEVADIIDQYHREGIIRGFGTVIDWEKVQKRHVTALIELRITPMKNYGFDFIANQIAAFPEVESVYLMSGGYDLGVTLHAEDFRDVALFVSERLASIEGVLSTATHFVLRRYKDSGFSFVDDDKDGRSEFDR